MRFVPPPGLWNFWSNRSTETRFLSAVSNALADYAPGTHLARCAGPTSRRLTGFIGSSGRCGHLPTDRVGQPVDGHGCFIHGRIRHRARGLPPKPSMTRPNARLKALCLAAQTAGQSERLAGNPGVRPSQRLVHRGHSGQPGRRRGRWRARCFLDEIANGPESANQSCLRFLQDLYHPARWRPAPA